MPGPDIVPLSQWGKDHWTTFAYAHHCILNAKGRLDARRMRTHPRVHRQLVAVGFGDTLQDGSAYPTRLKDGATIDRHDDWSCLEDAVSLGLIITREIWRKGRRHEPFGCIDVAVKFTDVGWKLWHEFDKHIGTHQNNWSTTFAPSSLVAIQTPALE